MNKKNMIRFVSKFLRPNDANRQVSENKKNLNHKQIFITQKEISVYYGVKRKQQRKKV